MLGIKTVKFTTSKDFRNICTVTISRCYLLGQNIRLQLGRQEYFCKRSIRSRKNCRHIFAKGPFNFNLETFFSEKGAFLGIFLRRNRNIFRYIFVKSIQFLGNLSEFLRGKLLGLLLQKVKLIKGHFKVYIVL